MVTARKPRPKTKPAARAARTASRRAPASDAGAMQRKVERIIKRRAPALRKLD
jgi:hypothetical protein